MCPPVTARARLLRVRPPSAALLTGETNVHSSDCIKWVKVNSGAMESTAGLPLIVGHEMMGENPPDGGKPSCFGPTGHLT